ncbi:hypothetical protein L195_g051204 [Trifolium pratense]|uniref:Uncharacterized protein n=1 Tax=Trifolium pratense TaxID=57577 RepID=A0A2K3JYA6_TRIPR|nr:hypothetical protein L195_g051204 [Trifolium pratense]
MSDCLSNSESDFDDVPVRGKKLLSSLNLGTCSISNSDGSVKKRLSTLPIKRHLDNTDSFCTSVKKPKVCVRKCEKRDKRRANHNEQMKDFESTKKQFEDWVIEKQCDRRLKELHSKGKHVEVQAKELESKQLEIAF